MPGNNPNKEEILNQIDYYSLTIFHITFHSQKSKYSHMNCKFSILYQNIAFLFRKLSLFLNFLQHQKTTFYHRKIYFFYYISIESLNLFKNKIKFFYQSLYCQLYLQQINFYQRKKIITLRYQNRNKMLPYHTIYPQKREQNDSEFVHYLSLGSYSTSFNNSNILSFSKITLNPKKYLPKLSYDDLKAKCESQGSKFHTLVIPLYGNLMIDQVPVSNVIEQQVNEKEVQKNNIDAFKITQMKFVCDPEYVSNKEEKDKNAIFLYLLCKIPTEASESEILHEDRLISSIQQKKVNHYPISIGSSSVQISFIQVLQDTNITLNPNDFFYLEKGKIIMYPDELQEKIEFKNKGNKKGQQNYIDNMIYAVQKINILVEKDSLLFLISTKENAQE